MARQSCSVRNAYLACAILLGWLPMVRAQEARRGVPSRLRHALIGCWDLGEGETYEIAPEGATGLRARWSVDGERYAETMFYDPESRRVSAGCSRRSHHGQVCVFGLGDGDTIEVAEIGLYLHLSRARTMTPCAAGVHVEEPQPIVHPIPLDAPVAQLLEARRRDVEATRTPTGDADGWTLYGPDLAIRYEAGLAMRVRATVVATGCEDAARAAGFAPIEGSFALHRADGCEWPGLSARHRLAAHVAGRWSNGVIEIWRTQ